MNYAAIETEVVARLNALMTTNGVTGFIAVALPDTDDEYNKPLPNNGRAFVEVGSDVKDEEVSSTSAIRQLETININIIIQSKFRHNSGSFLGAFSIEELARKYLVGWRPSHCNRTYKTAFKFSQRMESSSTWEYILSLATTTLIVEDTDAANDPLITQITVNSTGNSSVTPTS